MKKNLIKVCVLVLMVFSVSQLLKQPTETHIQQKVVIVEVPVFEIGSYELEQILKESEGLKPLIKEDMTPHVIVVDNSDMIYEDIDVFCLAKNIFHEAGIESDIGKYAVAQVTLNRVASRKYPNSVCKVVLQRYQFSWANKRSMHWTHPKGPNWNRSYEIAQQVMGEGYRVKGLENSKYYHADYIKPHWSRKMTHVSTIGRHIFYTNDAIY
jgi:spore germination cell wall hydrolase CwlJ-like protein|tara:strand:+ start:983 stop:1615 length:633 start_codon:yes stop_codon:yes gene_type:complete